MKVNLILIKKMGERYLLVQTAAKDDVTFTTTRSIPQASQAVAST